MHATRYWSLLVVLSCLTAAATASCSNSSYYVMAPDGDPCPNSLSTCQELSYYINQKMFTNNTVFCFLKGHHILDQPVIVKNVYNLTLQGMGSMEMGPHETVMQSPVVIKSSRYAVCFAFVNSQFITVANITVTNCTGLPVHNYYDAIGLALNNTLNTHLKHVSIQNSSGFGLLAFNCLNLSIEKSSFYHNQYHEDINRNSPLGANARISYYGFSLGPNRIDVISSNFSFSLGSQFWLGSGLSIELYSEPAFRHDIVIDNVIAYNNSGMGNINIVCSAS